MKNKIENYKKGRKNGYPICCILHFLFTRAAAKKRGVIYDEEKNDAYVPCGCHIDTSNPYWYSFFDFLTLRQIKVMNDGELGRDR